MKAKYLMNIVVVLVAIALSACSVGPFEEPIDPANPEGPGVFTGKKGEFSVTDFFSDKKEDKASQRSDTTRSVIYSDVDLPAMDEKSFKEFEEFRAWRRAKQSGSIDFQEYQDWQAYQQYRRFKEQEKSTEK